ncbi:MFS transporter [Paenibacillus rhizosphaerae]|uniref:MFS transporter n=2 Tax=Paenibacillus TaxID=44249 RepID=A0A1R1EEK4_9BACL|nr:MULTISPECIES: MFS transporter [Paenibacillus]OMF50260.1 MFS transporter [Paenibacillus rhizosphaerae]OXL86975.1 MFS transporter [Paenibacillus sp. SSG-1]UYO05273.1 MFS transporter [Paenibacillus sp. PSB04]GIO57199.1 MFS metabolite transporter [Paenibacillus cineris]
MQENGSKPSSLTSLKAFNFLIYGTMVIFTSYFQLYLQDAGMNKLEIGSLMALGPLISLLANPVWTFASERLRDTKRSLLLMMAGTLLLTQFVFHADTFTMIYVAMMLFFFFQSPMFAQSNTLILGYIPDQPHRFGAFRMWGSIGWAVTAVAAGLFLDRIGISRLSFVFTGILVLAIVSVLLLPPLKRTSETPPMRLRGFGRFAVNRYFIAFIVLGMAVSVPTFMNNTFMSLYITELGGSKTVVGLAVFLSSILEIGVLILFNRYLRRKLSTLVGCLSLVSLLFVLRWQLMANATSPVEIAVIQILHSITFGGFFFVGTQVVRLLTPAPFRGPAQALYTLTWSGISGMLGSLAGGWLFQNFGGAAMYKICVMLALIGAAGFGIMWYWIRVQHHTQAGAAGTVTGPADDDDSPF